MTVPPCSEIRTSLESGIGPSAGEHKSDQGQLVKSADATESAKSGNLQLAAEGARILRRLVPAPDKGPGYRRDPETGFVFYSSEWLGDGRELRGLRVVH